MADAKLKNALDGRYNIFHHPFGTTTELTAIVDFQGMVIDESTSSYDGGVWEDCCDCGDNERAGYQLLIYSQDQDPRTEKLDKPILVTQGFDPNYGLMNQFKYVQFNKLLDTVYDKDNTERELPDDDGLLKELYGEGYDIALLLWKHPSISMETNARVTLQALRWLSRLSDHTPPRPGTEPVIIGPSMGGLVTRLALQQAGANFAASGIKARLFIAFDSPNRGAEIPMSLQAAVTYLKTENDIARGILANLAGPAARQLLLSS